MDFLTRSLMSAAGAADSFSTTAQFIGFSSRRVITTDTESSLTLSGIQANDVVFAVYTSENMATGTLESNSTDLSSDWNGPFSSLSSPRLAFWWKVATGTSVTVDFNTIPSNDRLAYSFIFYAFRNLNTTTPYLLIGTRSPFFGDSFIAIEDLDIGRGPNYNTYAVAHGSLDDDINVTIAPPSGYTTIETIDTSQAVGDNATMSVAYGPLAALGGKTGLGFQASSSDTYRSHHFFLVPAGEDGTLPVITGSAVVSAAVGGTAVATYSASESVTWTLGGADASLFSISSGGVVTYNSASTLGARDIDVIATDAANLRNSLSVVVNAFSSGGAAGGGITLVTSASGTTDSALTLTLNGLQTGDVVFLSYASDSANTTVSGYTQVAIGYTSSAPYHKLWYKIATSTSESISFPAATAANRGAFGMFAFRGVDNTSPILTKGANTDSSGTTINIVDHYILSDSVELVVGALDDDSGVTATPPTGYTEIIDQNVAASGGSAAHLSISYKDVNGNTTETGRQIVFTGGNDAFIGYSLTLNPD